MSCSKFDEDFGFSCCVQKDIKSTERSLCGGHHSAASLKEQAMCLDLKSSFSYSLASSFNNLQNTECPANDFGQ